MKVVFETKEVLPKISQVSSVINNKNIIAVLADIFFTIRKDYMIVTASDGENWVTERADTVESDFEGKFCVEAKTLRNCLSTLTGETVTMTLDEESKTVSLDYADGMISLPYESADNFPYPNSVSDGASEIVISSVLFRKAISLASIATQTSVIRPIMEGVHFDFNDGKMTVWGASYMKIVKFVDNVIEDKDNVINKFTLPPKASSVLMTVLDGINDDVKLRFNDKVMSVINKDMKITARLLEGNYPNCDNVIPKNNTISFDVCKERMLQAMKRIMSIENSYNMIEMNISDDGVTLSSDDKDNGRSSKEVVKCDVHADESLSICFNGSVLVEMMKNIDDESVTFEMSEKNKPAILRAKDDTKKDSYLSAVMPFAIGQVNDGN